MCLLVKCLNPYCSGQWSHTIKTITATVIDDDGLNPYCSGQWSHTAVTMDETEVNSVIVS